MCSLVEDAWRFLKIFDVACTFYKILENAYKILHALKHDYIMEVLRKIPVHFVKNLWFFYATYKNFQSFDFLETTWVFNLVVFRNFPSRWEIFPYTLFNNTCNQKLGCVSNLFISWIFLFMTSRNFHCGQFPIIK